jgi:hypothetical protein
VREVGGSPLSNGPLLRHQQSSVSRRHVEHLIDFVTAQINPIDGVGEFSSESDPHDFGWKAIWIPIRDTVEVFDVLNLLKGREMRVFPYLPQRA